MLVLVLFIVAAVIFGLDFIAGVGPATNDPHNSWRGTRFSSLALCLVSIALAVWHHGG